MSCLRKRPGSAGSAVLVVLCVALVALGAGWAGADTPAPAAAAPAATTAAPVLPPGVVTPPAPPVFPQVLTLTPAQAADLAAQRALEIQQAREGVEIAEAAVTQARVGQRLTGSATLLEGRDGPVSHVTLNGTSITLGSNIIRTGTLTLTQPLYTGGRVEAQIRAAQAGVSAAGAQTVTTIRGIRRAAEEGIYGILRAQELAEVARRQVEANREHLRIAQAMFDAGTVPQFEVVRAQTQVASADGNLVAAVTGVDQAKAGLRRVMGLPQTQELGATPPAQAAMRPAGELADLIATGQAARPEIGIFEAQVRAAEASLRLARATDNLSAGVQGQYLHNGSAAGLASSESTWQVVLSLSKPLFDGGLRGALTRGASAGLRRAQDALDLERQQIALDVTQQYLAANQALKQLQVATQGVVQAREAARIAGVRFGAGVGTGLEVLDAQTAQAAAEATQVNAGYDLQLALVRLRDAMGQPLEGGPTS